MKYFSYLVLQGHWLSNGVSQAHRLSPLCYTHIWFVKKKKKNYILVFDIKIKIKSFQYFY